MVCRKRKLESLTNLGLGKKLGSPAFWGKLARGAVVLGLGSLGVAAAAVDNSDPAGANKYFLKGNDFNFYDKEVDELWQRQDSIIGPLERKKLVVEMQRHTMEDNGKLALFWLKWCLGVWREVKNYKMGNTYNNNKFQDVWLAK